MDKKGAFTGADPGGSIGLFQMANNGTLFLDEVGEIPYNVQAKLLRVLDTGEIRKIGSSKSEKVNVRIIAATNRDLEQMVQEKKFREDLFYRLNVIPIEIPPLRERQEDIIPMAEEFLRNFNRKYLKDKYLSEYTKENFLRYSWKGNVRELRNIIERITIIGEEDEINYNINNENINKLIKETPTSFQKSTKKQDFIQLKDAVMNYENDYIQNALNHFDGNMTKTAEVLGVHRTSLYKKLKKQ